MDLSDSPLFHLLQRKMDYLTQRQAVLSQNISNVDTPQYEAHDLVPFTFELAMADRHPVQPRLTNPRHLQGARREGDTRVERERNAFEVAPDGNSVVLDEEMKKVGDVQLEYEAVANLYHKQLSLYKIALGKSA
ncbi:MAG: flagellar basal body rod protein FlgB [Azospirillaceae bacterium]|nr:flagellar basal body rod protein FlgB [Azospirillaceae bacterium]